MSASSKPQKDASRGTLGIQQRNSSHASPAEVKTPYNRRIAQIYSAPNSTQTRSKSAQTKPPSLMAPRTRIPAPTKITIPDTLTKAELSRSSTYISNKTPDPSRSRQTLKERFIQGVLSTQLGQAVSDNLAPHIPRTAVAGFPEDDAFHSRNSYIDATIALWTQMRAHETNGSSSNAMVPVIQPDKMPIWTDNNVTNPDLPKSNEQHQPIPKAVNISRPHPTILRPGSKVPVRQPDPRPHTSQAGEVDYRMPIHQPLKAQTYHGKDKTPEPLQALTYHVGQERQDHTGLIPAKDKIDYRVPIYQSHKANTIHGDRVSQASVTVQKDSNMDLLSLANQDPDERWQISSSGDFKYWTGQGQDQDGLILKAAPVIDMTETLRKRGDRNASSTSSNKSHRQQQIYGSFSKVDLDKLKRSSHAPATGPKQAQTYPASAPRKTPLVTDVLVNPRTASSSKNGVATAIPEPVSLTQRKISSKTMSTTAIEDETPKMPTRLPRPSPIYLSTEQYDPASLIGLKPQAEKKARIKPTAEQRQRAAEILNASNPQPSRTHVARPPIGPKHPDRKRSGATKPLNPQAKTFTHDDKPVEYSRFLPESNSTTQVPIGQSYRLLQRHSNYYSYGPGLNPTAKTFHQTRH